MFAAILPFEIKPQYREAFAQALVEHGRLALPNEPETLRFDVIEDRSNPACVLLYEAYASLEALDQHVQGASHNQFVRILKEHDWLMTPLDEPPHPPFRPFVVGSGFALFTSAQA